MAKRLETFSGRAKSVSTRIPIAVTARGFLPCLAVVLVVGIGCAEPRSEGIIEGMVQCQEMTLPVGSRIVVMSMKTGAVTVADVRADGSFAAKKRLTPGQYVAFLAASPSTEEPPDAVPARQQAGKENMPVSGPSIPSRYWNEGTTPWLVDVVAGRNHFVLSIEQ